MSKCQWIGNGEGCTHEAVNGRSYCLEHLAMVYKVGTARARRKKEERTVDKVRLVESLMNEAIAELDAEGFDCYGDSERKASQQIEEEVL